MGGRISWHEGCTTGGRAQPMCAESKFFLNFPKDQ
jgi:hypothetical protein